MRDLRAAVLLSASRHPLLDRPVPTRGELQALQLARSLRAEIIGVHAGADPSGPRAALGHGLEHLVHLALPPGADPVPALAEFLREARITLALCGPRSRGGDETGLVPYRLAERLGWELAAGALTLERGPAGLDVTQALARGERRVLELALPLVAIPHSGAPAPAPYAFARERRGRVERREMHGEPTADPAAPLEERPLRRRAAIVENAASGSGTRLVAPEPEAAARAVLAELRRLKAIP